ncbi:aldo/keto reductase [Subtercola endophyticus]|uniref:aldo/keto reductase n=1 Tax=Subtercola endophyticus TaxID=2895559 RepID=UPI001E590E42|nr:aldo/keto reductase [Subtercola endophyticus]UFS58770.1 aldo/keto reductase [Subtercola endophyticus]
MTSTTTPIMLNSGAAMPPIGFGCWQVGRAAIAEAARAGYRAFDTATFYGNEKQVGQAIGDAGLARADVFVTTKVWRNDMGYAGTLKAYDTSRRLLGVESVDLYLIHWPQPDDKLVTETWRAMEHLLDRGEVKSIGVSNFEESDLDLLARHSDVVPAVNQIELHPLRQRKRLVAANTARGIVTTAWSPLGQGGPVLRNPELKSVAAAHGVSVAQVVLRWMLQKQIVTIPRSGNAERIAQNIDLDGFELSPAEVARIDALAN